MRINTLALLPLLIVPIRLPAPLTQLSIDQIAQAPRVSVPNTPPPKDYSRRPGGGLPVDTCLASPDDIDLPLIAIRPEWPQDSEPGSTQKNTPTLLFYIPQTPETSPTGEFILQTRGNSRGRDIQNVYQRTFALSETVGVLPLTLPTTNDSGEPLLKENEYYRWYFKVHCTATNEEQREHVLKGWIRLMPESGSSTRELVSDTDNEPIYYDELADAALAQLHSEPLATNVEMWQSWLQTIGLEAYSTAHIMDEIRLDEIRLSDVE